MEQLRRKLKSRRGATILLALALLLLCMMVAASLLTAAVSNAGKVRSNKEEQQKYLVLSSALRLVCGELEKAGYTRLSEGENRPLTVAGRVLVKCGGAVEARLAAHSCFETAGVRDTDYLIRAMTAFYGVSFREENDRFTLS